MALDAETVDTHCYLVGDEDCGVGIGCRTCDRGGMPIAYYPGISGNPHPDLPTVTGIFHVYLLALEHVHEYHSGADKD